MLWYAVRSPTYIFYTLQNICNSRITDIVLFPDNSFYRLGRANCKILICKLTRSIGVPSHEVAHNSVQHNMTACYIEIMIHSILISPLAELLVHCEFISKAVHADLARRANAGSFL